MFGLPIINLESLKAKAEQKEKDDNAVKGIVTAFPKNPPPSGIAYSKNFARFQRYGRFVVQVKD